MLDAPVLPEQRLRLPGIGDAKFVASLLPGGETNRHVASVDAPLGHQLIELPEKFRRLELVRRKTAQDSRGDRAIKGRGTALSADVSQSDAELLRAIRKKVVQVAADFAGGKNPRRDVESKIDAGYGTQQRVLQALRGGELAFHAGFIAGELLVQPRVFE